MRKSHIVPRGFFFQAPPHSLAAPPPTMLTPQPCHEGFPRGRELCCPVVRGYRPHHRVVGQHRPRRERHAQRRCEAPVHGLLQLHRRHRLVHVRRQRGRLLSRALTPSLFSFSLHSLLIPTDSAPAPSSFPFSFLFSFRVRYFVARCSYPELTATD